MVAYVDNPTKFYVHRAEQRNEADKLVRRITTWATEPRNIRPLSAVNLNAGYLYAGRWTNVRNEYTEVPELQDVPQPNR